MGIAQFEVMDFVVWGLYSDDDETLLDEEEVMLVVDVKTRKPFRGRFMICCDVLGHPLGHFAESSLRRVVYDIDKSGWVFV